VRNTGRLRTDVAVVGGGSAGCVLAARLSEDGRRSVCLLEAGPDYGPFAEGHWPPDLLDARALPFSHDWGYEGGRSASRARVLGGCSASNACMVVRGSDDDYDEWRAGGWSSGRLDPYLRRAKAAIRTRRFADEELSVWHRAVLAAGPAAGFPLLDDPDARESVVGVGTFPCNVAGTVRWNAGFAYLDPARGRPGLTILGDTLVDRVRLRGRRAVSVVAQRAGKPLEVEAETIVLAAGAYSSPLILQRSGIGPAEVLESTGVEVASDLPGVGANLVDQPGAGLEWTPSRELVSQAGREDALRGLFEAQTVVKARSSGCAEGTWDLHVLPWISPSLDERSGQTTGYRTSAAAFALKPRSRGSVRLRSTDPEASPAIDHGFLSDPTGADLLAVVDAIEVARRLVAEEPLASFVVEEVRPGRDADLATYVQTEVRGYFHPVGTCALGPAEDPLAVVDGSGRVHGIDNLYVCDASIMPTIPRANTHLTVLALAEAVAAMLC
jgi:choline dehydrogenase